MPRTPAAADLNRYDAKVFTLIPLHKPHDLMKLKGGKTKEVGKAPLDSKWTTKAYNSKAVRARCIKEERNAGVRLTDEQLVIDVDPRNGGEAGFAALCHDLGIDGDAFPRVITGSGGFHCYMQKPADMLIRDTLESDDYDGVEFKSRGRQVVAAGSIHPNGTPYRWSDDHPSIEDGLKKAPKALLRAIERPVREGVSGGGQYSQEQIAEALSKLDVTAFDSNDKWFTLMQACHHASGGDARNEWIDWSTGDSNYAADAYLIGKRWDSLHADRNDGVTYKTLNKILRDNGASSVMAAPDNAEVSDDFDEDLDPEWLKASGDDDWLNGSDDGSDPLDDFVELTTADKSHAFKPAVIAALARLPLNEWESMRSALAEAGFDRLTKLDEAVKAAGPKRKKKKAKTLASTMIELARSEGEFSQESDGSVFVSVVVGEVRKTFALKSGAYRDWLSMRCYANSGHSPSRTVADEVIRILRAMAEADCAPKAATFIRVASFADEVYIDLANDKWQAVRITAEGWSVVGPEELPGTFRFKRPAAMLPLPTPEDGGDICELRDFINVEADGIAPSIDDSSFVMLVMFIVSCFRHGPYGVLSIDGESGTAKTTTCEIVRMATDPARMLTKAFPRSDDDLFVGAAGSHLQAFDNVSTIPHWISDSLCRLTSGGGHSKRELYSDDGEVILKARRPVVINGIHPEMQRGDLLDRSIIVSLSPITKRRSESEVKAGFGEALPRIFGAVCDLIAHGLKRLPDVKIDGKTPRLADFETFGRACETLVWQAGTFRRVYAAMRADAKDKLLRRSPVAAALTDYMRKRLDKDFETTWTGSAETLEEALAAYANTGSFDADWPGSANALTRRLREIAPLMREARNIDIQFGRIKSRRDIVIRSG